MAATTLGLDRDRAVAAEPGDLPLLQHPQQLGLRGERQLADLVQEQGAALRGLERALARGDRAGEGTPLVPEQLALDQVLGQRRAVDGDERGRWRRAHGGAGPGRPAPCPIRSRP